MTLKQELFTAIDDGPQIVVLTKGRRHVVSGLAALGIRAKLREIERLLPRMMEDA